ncbi:MAG: CHASE domain-containing protein [Burkholderiales bacterium]|nr:CHASE domain-containing protein [Burkholderiales bacterium]
MPTKPVIDRQRLFPWAVGVGVAVLGGVGSALLAYQQAQAGAELAQARLAQAANGLTQALQGRIGAYAEIAFGLRGLFIVNPDLRRNAFINAASRLDVDTRYPGVKNIAFTRYVRAQDKAAFEARVRADTSVDPQGYPDFAIRPPGARAEYFVADYLWPQSGSKGIHGLDISAQPANLASMHYSRNTGNPVASGPFDLLQESSHRTGFVIRVPVFRGTEFLGAVAVTLRVFDLFENLEREGYLRGLRLSLSDTGPALGAVGDGTVPPGRLMYATPSPATVGASAPHFQRTLSLYGRTWALDFQPAQSFLSPGEQRTPLWIGLAGGVMSLLLGALVTALAQGRRDAQARAVATGEALASERDLSAAVLNHAGALVVVLDREGRIRRFNRESERVSGLLFAEVQGRFPWDTFLPPEIAQTVRAQTFEALANPSQPLPQQYVNEWQQRDGTRRLIEWNNSVLLDATGALDYVVAIGTDVTQRNQHQTELEVSLREKNALLKEVHHRVKNNLQVITSLLRLESYRSTVPEATAVLQTMQGRIRAMAQLHESLYRSGTYSAVDLGAYLGQIATQAFHAQRLSDKSVQLALHVSAVRVGMDQAMTCGLLVNELVVNSLKHGFPDGTAAGEVCLELQPADPDTPAAQGLWRLQVRDTGVGLPPDFEHKRHLSLGMQLVGDLCHQAGGTLSITSTPGAGAAFSVVFTPQMAAPLPT